MPTTANYGKLPDGTPYINNKPAKPCKREGCAICEHMGDVNIPWLCPECGAHLGSSGICLNACHLSAASMARFTDLMRQSAARVKVREEDH